LLVRRTFVIAFAAAALVSAVPAIAATPTGPVFGLRAVDAGKLGYYVYTASAGSAEHGSVLVTNTGDQTGTVKIYAADATTGATTGTVYLTDAAPAGVGTWIALSSSELELKPNETRKVSFSVRVPGAANAGQYVGGIVAETVQETSTPSSKQKTNVQIKVRNLSIVAYEVDIPGPEIAKFTISTVSVGGSQGRQQVLVHVSNDGNTLRKPTGAVTISNTSGVPVEKIPFRMDTFLPHTAIDYPIQLTKALPPGDYTASVQLSYEGTGSTGIETSSAAPQFSVSQENVTKVFKPTKPTQVGPGGVVAASKGSSKLFEYIAIALGALLLAGGGYFFAVMRNRRPVTVTATPVPPPPTPSPEPLTPAATLPPSPPPAAAGSGQGRCEGFHYWQVDWDRGEPGPDGPMTYPHRCRNCGVEVRATDIGDASAKAGIPAG
jgi:hypothetical protein